MKLSKFLPVCLMVAAFAFVWMVVASQFNLLAWVAFITWGGYFLSGVKTKNAVREAISFFLGVLAAMLIVWFGAMLTPVLGMFAFPFVVAVAAFFIVLLELVPWFDMAPGYFFGAAAFFAAGAKLESALAVGVIIPGLFGVFIGWLTGFIRGNMLKEKGRKK